MLHRLTRRLDKGDLDLSGRFPERWDWYSARYAALLSGLAELAPYGRQKRQQLPWPSKNLPSELRKLLPIVTVIKPESLLDAFHVKFGLPPGLFPFHALVKLAGESLADLGGGELIKSQRKRAAPTRGPSSSVCACWTYQTRSLTASRSWPSCQRRLPWQAPARPGGTWLRATCIWFVPVDALRSFFWLINSPTDISRSHRPAAKF